MRGTFVEVFCCFYGSPSLSMPYGFASVVTALIPDLKPWRQQLRCVSTVAARARTASSSAAAGSERRRARTGSVVYIAQPLHLRFELRYRALRVPLTPICKRKQTENEEEIEENDSIAILHFSRAWEALSSSERTLFRSSSSSAPKSGAAAAMVVFVSGCIV